MHRERGLRNSPTEPPRVQRGNVKNDDYAWGPRAMREGSDGPKIGKFSAFDFLRRN